MCGITGFIDKKITEKDKIIKDMTDLIKHRGPDKEEYYTDENISMGLRRLSIIDLEQKKHSIYNEDRTKLITFDGKIYNYQYLKEDLEAKGHIFITNADYEVVLHGYEEYKEDILLMLRGMFSFVIYDINEKELFGARDFYGIKPFYYYQKGKTFMYSSEIKSFLANPSFEKEFNTNMLEQYLTFQYSVGKETFFKNVYKLEPGHYFKYKNDKLTIKKYYELNLDNDTTKTLEEYTKGIKDLIGDSVKIHKMDDLEVGSFLSGGVDSALITTLSKVNKTFTIGYNNRNYSEIECAKEISDKLKVENISKKISKQEYFDKIPEIMYYMDEPLADPSAISLYFLTNLTSKHVKVALSGEGADEIFGGCKIYHEQDYLSFYNKIPYPVRKTIGILLSPLKDKKVFKFLVKRSNNLEDYYVGNNFVFDNKEIKKILSYKKSDKSYKDITRPYYEKIKKYDQIQKMQYIDFHFSLVGDILLKTDKMSMANSLEVRTPYLDRIIVDFVKNMPTKYKIKCNKTKYAFRKVASEVLDKEYSEKKNFTPQAPIKEWIKETDINKKIRETFNESGKFFDTKEIIKLLNEHIEGKKDNSSKIWTIYTFMIWYKQYFVER